MHCPPWHEVEEWGLEDCFLLSQGETGEGSHKILGNQICLCFPVPFLDKLWLLTLSLVNSGSLVPIVITPVFFREVFHGVAQEGQVCEDYSMSRVDFNAFLDYVLLELFLQ
jgi:hypothetical protein